MSDRIYCDTPTDNDLLGFEPYVEAIKQFLTDKDTKAPITLSIEGQWGCGKSSFMKQLQVRIEELNKGPVEKAENEITGDKSQTDSKSKYKTKTRLLDFLFLNKKRKKYFTIWFNCWRYEKEDELWAAFALNLIEQLSDNLSWERRLWAQFKLTCLRLEFKWNGKNSFYLNMIIFVTLVSVSIAYSIPKLIEVLSSNSIDGPLINVLATLTVIVGPILPTLSIGKSIKDEIKNPFDFSKFISNPKYADHISFIEHFHSDFSKIIKSYAGDSKVYVFIDDLDRCETPKAAELMQALNLMITDDANIYFTIGMDRRIISAGLASKNKDILQYLNIDGLQYGYEFIEKFIQLPFKVPSPKKEDFKSFVNTQKVQKNHSKTSWSLSNLLHKLPQKLKSSFRARFISEQNNKPTKANDIESTKETLSDIPKEEKNGLTKEELEDSTLFTSDYECYEHSYEHSMKFESILEMIAPALDNNPRRVKQFLNLFRFQKTIGFKTGLFSYKDSTDNTKPMWNCKKLAKFVAISIMWPSIISALSSDRTLLDKLQQYALKPDNENEKVGFEQNLPEKYIHDEKLISLLRAGCTEDEKDSQIKDEYSLSNVDFSRLLQISPIIAIMPSPKPPISSSETPISSSETPISVPNYLTEKEIVGWVVRKKSNLVKVNLEGVNLRGAYLQRANFKEANLTEADLTEADLKEANLKGAKLDRAKFQRANLQLARFSQGVNLQGINLSEADLSGAYLIKAYLQGAILQGTKLNIAELQGANLQGANLHMAELRGANLRGANLREADLQGANLREADLQGADLQEANLTETIIDRTDLEGANFEGVYNLSIDQLSRVKTLYNAKLDKEFFIKLKEIHPELFA